MKTLISQIVALCYMVLPLLAGESALTKTFQPLNGLGAGRIQVTEVTCHDWDSHSGLPTSIYLICASNIPPTNNPGQAKDDLNLASVGGLKFQCEEVAGEVKITLDARGMKIKNPMGWKNDDIVRATLECLRRCLPPKSKQKPILLLVPEGEVAWLKKIVSDFNKHDRAKVFYENKS